jgi:hypothetical protein
MATITELKKKITALEKGLKNKALKAEGKAKIRVQIAKLKDQVKGMSKSKSSSTAKAIAQRIKQNKNTTSKKQDGERPAKPVGIRTSASGNKYYEYRSNRTDVKQPSKKVPVGSRFEDGGMMAKGGMVVTSIKDIPNFKQRLDEGKITYRGLGMGKLYNDFYDIAGESGVRIKVDGKEYFITDTEFDTFSRGSDGKMRIRFDAPQRKGYADGGMMADGGKLEAGVYRVGKPTKVSPNLYEQKIVEIFDNGDISTASDYGRNLSDFKSQKYPVITKQKLEEQYKMANGGMMAKGGETKKFKIDDVVYNKKTKTIGIVRLEDERGETKTDADGNVNTSDLQHYKPFKYPNQKDAKVAPSTEKEINSRGLWNPFRQMADGGMMGISGETDGEWVGAGMYSKGGGVSPTDKYVLYGVDRDSQVKMLGEFNGMKAAERKMNYYFDSGLDDEFLKMGYMPKVTFEKEKSRLTYADGGSLDLLATTAGTPTTTTGGTTFSNADLSSFFAKGGLINHGLRIGDVIQRYSGNSIVVFNKFTNEYFDVDLSKGERIIRKEYGGTTELHRTED